MQAIPNGAWVVVANGARARLLENVGAAFEPRLVQRGEMDSDEIYEGGPAGVQPEQVDIEEATFATRLARKLNHEALTNAYSHLVLIADPKTLGQVRPLLHKEVLAKLVGDLPNDLTNSPLEEIERILH